jgi:CheY-like chemotaxis protein
VLVVENDPVDMILYEKILDGSEFQVLPARTLEEARRALRRVRPAAVLLDVMLDVESGWTLLSELKGDAATRDVSVLVLTVVDGREQAMALGADDFRPKPVDQGWLLGRLRLLAPRPALTALLIDDAESDRRVLRDFLSRGGRYRVIEATRGGEGLSRARAERPGVIFLDLVMPDMSGAEVLGRLKGDPETAGIPVIINTSKIVDDDERGRLSAGAAAILQKGAGPGPEAFDRIREALVRAGLGHVSAAPEA